MLTKTIALFLILNFGASPLFGEDLYVEMRSGELQAYTIDQKSQKLNGLKNLKNLKTPLGSLWKLFVFSYNKENALVSEPYTCSGLSVKEVFCCKKGESVNEDTALVNSCGLYFSPHRLRISQKRWKKFWYSKKLKFDWLTNLSQFKAERVIKVSELLAAIDKLKSFPKAKGHLDKALVNVILKGTASKSLSELGAYPRIKTFTWDDPLRKGSYNGGFAGWLTDGTLIWAMGEGRSSDFLSRISPTLDTHWKKSVQAPKLECVSVRYFHDYKIKKITDLRHNKEARVGVLNGTYKILFYTGREITVNSNSNLSLKKEDGTLYIDGRMDVNSYIARVLDREVSSKFERASEAFSIVMRSYLYERASKISGCYHVIDSSKFQRVSANIPTSTSLSIANKTSGLVLNNASQIRYHLNKEGKNMISWLKAKSLDLLGNNFEEILKSSYPDSKIVYKVDHYRSLCGSLSKANRWLEEKSPKWHKVLVRHAGYEKPDKFKVCKLHSGAPFSNKKTNEIFVRGFDGFESQYSIAHEYLHIAFKHHPIGNNEREIDRIAKKLVTLF